MISQAGNKIIIVTAVDDMGIISKNNKVIQQPVPNNIKSKGLNIPKINCPFFVLAGIK